MTNELPTEPYRTEETTHDAPDGTTLAVRLLLPVGTGRDDPVPVQLFAAAERPVGLAAVTLMFAPSDLHCCDFFQDGTMAYATWSLQRSMAGHTVDWRERTGDSPSLTANEIRSGDQTLFYEFNRECALTITPPPRGGRRDPGGDGAGRRRRRTDPALSVLSRSRGDRSGNE